MHDPRLDKNKMADTEAFLGLISTNKRINTKMKPLNIGLELNNWYIRIVSGELISLIASTYHTVFSNCMVYGETSIYLGVFFQNFRPLSCTIDFDK